MSTADKYQPRLKKTYEDKIRPKMIEKGSYKNVMEIPQLEKISISVSLKDAIQNPKTLEALAADISNIAGQKAVLTKSKQAISNFKLRENVNIGCRVTLRLSLIHI